MESVSSIDPVLAKAIGGLFICWLTGYGAGKIYGFLSDIFKRASRSQ